MTVYEIARLIAEIARAFGLAWPAVRAIAIKAAPHMEPHLDDAIEDMDRARAKALKRIEADHG